MVIRRRDAIAPALLAVAATIELIAFDVDRVWAPIALQVVSCGLLALRARWPWAMSTAGGALSALMPYLGTELDEPVVPILIIGLACWTLGRRLEGWRGLASVLLIEAVILVDVRTGFITADALFVTVILMPPYFAGVGASTLTARNRRLAEQAEELRQLQETVRQEAAAAERGRIARELHDVIAHSVSAMVVQASAASALVRTDPDRAAQAVDDVASTGRQALAETGRLLHLLRDHDDELGLAPDCGMDRLADLVADMQRRGLDVALSVEGSLSDLPVGVDLSAYRICQEAMTNALKHSRDRQVSILVRRTGGRLRSVPTTPGPRGQVSWHGLGLLGMAERVSVFGGTLTHGVDGTVRVAALPGAAAEEA